MAINLGGTRKGVIAEINVTPMADVMIVLLIIFMVATPIIAGAPVRLPSAVSALETQEDRTEIVVRGDGSLSLDGTPVGLQGVGDLLSARSAATQRTVLVQADRDASYTDVARVLAACREAGVSEVALAAEPMGRP